MVDSPNTENYTLGKGVVYFDQKNLTTGLYMGERDLGNAPAFSFSLFMPADSGSCPRIISL